MYAILNQINILLNIQFFYRIKNDLRIENFKI